ncbi:transcription termination/antitermination protein NusG [Turneriella parva]|jgi:transcriptional antiterminator NusG|uniref:Transcription termination/antitermination protein NusG n=1 Tax=Turneriella parva (strain ATCC BAA-1111 / DSM 21527 / NCTC 11395 / H) TaxID=869212 RepID=I4B8B1_TURPD|nr:transcription termination/antitermination protein NusG [Turneriella parva]AFM13518.1 transcription antitermination protein nusG [Turneriella parva DSM 21527]
MAMQWYVVTTLSSHEDKVKKLLERQKDKWPDGSKVGQIKIPLHEMAELRGGKKRIVKKKLMPGYVFIECDLTDELQHRIRALPGIMGFVSAGAEPQVLSEEEMHALFTEMGSAAAEEKQTTRIFFTEGEIVKIIDGPFANFQGTVDDVNPEKGKVRVRVEIFGRATPVELDYLQVSKI